MDQIKSKLQFLRCEIESEVWDRGNTAGTLCPCKWKTKHLKISKTILDKAVFHCWSGIYSWKQGHRERTSPEEKDCVQVLELLWCEEVAWLQLNLTGACGCSAPCPWWLCVCRTRPFAAQFAPRRGWPGVVYLKAVRRPCGSLAVAVAPPVPCQKVHTVVSTHHVVVQASVATRLGVWRDHCTHWCMAKGCALTNGRWKKIQVRMRANLSHRG